MNASPFHTWLHDVERFLLVARIGGFILSPRDVDRLRQWFMDGIPLAAVLKGLSEGVRSFRYHHAPTDPLPHHLNYYTPFIKALPKKRPEPIVLDQPYEEAVSSPETAPSQQGSLRPVLHHLQAEIEWLALREPRPLERSIKEEYLTRLGRLEQSGEWVSWEEDELLRWLENLDVELLALYHGALDEARRSRLDEASAQVQISRPMLGRRAGETLARKQRQQALKKELGLPEFVD